MADLLIQEDPSIKRRRALAEAMMGQGMSSAPVGHWMEGVGRMAQAWAGQKMAGDADTEQKARQQSAMDALSKAMQPGETKDPVTGQVTKNEPSVDQLVQAMSQNPDLAPMAMNLRMNDMQSKAKNQAELEAAMSKPVQVGDQLVVPKTKEVLFEGRQKAPEGMRYGAGGEVEQIPGYVGMRSQIAAAGKPDNSTKVEFKQEGEEAKTVGKYYGDQYAEIQTGARKAQQGNARLDRLEQMLDNTPQGKLAPLGNDLKAWAKSAGIDLAAIGVDDTTSQADAVASITNAMALELRNPAGGAGMPGALSDKDREFLVQTVPNLEKTPEGNKKIIQYYRELNKRTAEEAKLARDYRAKHGSLDEGFYDELQQYADENPVFRDLKNGAIERNPQIDDLVDKYAQPR